jgi:hypothetical protein
MFGRNHSPRNFELGAPRGYQNLIIIHFFDFPNQAAARYNFIAALELGHHGFMFLGLLALRPQNQKIENQNQGAKQDQRIHNGIACAWRCLLNESR